MKLHILDLKDFLLKDDIVIFDFLENNFKVSFEPLDIQITKIFLIDETHLGRPDNVSSSAFGSNDYIDIILKFNNICNPFSMQLNDIILVPQLSQAMLKYIKAKKTTTVVNNTKELYLDSSKASKQDINRISSLIKIAAKNGGASEIKPTNLLREGEVPFIADGNVIRFAPSISNNKTT